MEKSYGDILKKESHHKHEIIRDDMEIVKWKENPQVREKLKQENVELGGLITILEAIGYDRNSEVCEKVI